MNVFYSCQRIPWYPAHCTFMFAIVSFRQTESEKFAVWQRHFSPMSSLFLTSSAMFLSAVATEHTTLSLSIRSSSTRMGSPFSLRTAARMYAANCTRKDTHTKRHSDWKRVETSNTGKCTVHILSLCDFKCKTDIRFNWHKGGELLNPFSAAEQMLHSLRYHI